jgi:hypothetical protein
MHCVPSWACRGREGWYELSGRRILHAAVFPHHDYDYVLSATKTADRTRSQHRRFTAKHSAPSGALHSTLLSRPIYAFNVIQYANSSNILEVVGYAGERSAPNAFTTLEIPMFFSLKINCKLYLLRWVGKNHSRTEPMDVKRAVFRSPLAAWKFQTMILFPSAEQGLLLG